MKQIQTLAKGAGITLIGLFISKLLGYLYRLIVARIGAEPYGLISIALGLVSLLVLFPLMGLDIGILRYVAYYKGKKENKKIYGAINFSLRLAIILGFILSVLIFIFSDKIAVLFFHNIKLGLVLKFFCIAIPFYAINRISLAALRAIKKIQYEVYSKAIFNNCCKIVLTLLLVCFLGWGLFGLSVAFLVGIIGMSLLSFYFLYKQILKPLKNYKSLLIEKELFAYSLPLMFYSFFYLVLAWIDTLMIGYFLDASKVGIYNAALPTAALLIVFPLAIRSLFMPTITTLYAQNEKSKIKQVYDFITRNTFLMNLPILFIFILFSKQFLKILFGADYVTGFGCLIILGIGYFVYSFLESSSALLNMLKRSKLILINSIIVAIVNVILNFFLIPHYGIVGGATATCVSLILSGILYSSEGWFFTRLQPFQTYYLRLLILLGITCFIIWNMSKILIITRFIDLAFFSFYFIGIYVALILLTKSFKKEDFELVKTVFLKIRKIYK